jgi:hypothetical protein
MIATIINSLLLFMNRLPYIILFFASLIINLIQIYYVASPLDSVYSDMRGYVERGYRIAVADNFVPFDSFYPPGTAYFFSIVFWAFGFAKGIHILTLIQALAISGAAMLVGLSGEALFRSKKISFFMAVLVAMYWPFIGQLSFFMAEPIFIFLLLFGQYLLILSIRFGGAHSKFFLIGLTYSLAMLIKGQCIGLILTALLVFILRQTAYLRPFAAMFILGLVFPLSLQLVLNASITGKPGMHFASNDAYNTYLGQSRREAIGCLDKEAGYFYIFHNNNSFFDKRLLPATVLPVSIMNREYFKARTLELWMERPFLQTIRSLQSVSELFSLIPHWPLRNLEKYQKYDISFGWGTLFLITLPAIYTIVISLSRRRYLLECTLLFLPIIVLSGIIFLSMGQPRYLVPFKYNFFLLAIPAFIDFKDKFLLLWGKIF